MQDSKEVARETGGLHRIDRLFNFTHIAHAGGENYRHAEGGHVP